MSNEIDLQKIMKENITPEVLEAIKASDQNVDYRQKIKDNGWKADLIPGEKTVTFRASKGKTHCDRKISRQTLESAYDPGLVKWQIWKGIYQLISADIPSEMSSFIE